jgi:hypothetical protein
MSSWGVLARSGASRWIFWDLQGRYLTGPDGFQESAKWTVDLIGEVYVLPPSKVRNVIAIAGGVGTVLAEGL